MKNEKFELSEKQVEQVSKIIGTPNFLLVAQNPENVDNAVDASIKVRGLSYKHLIVLGDHLIEMVKKEEPVHALMFMMNKTMRLMDGHEGHSHDDELEPIVKKPKKVTKKKVPKK